MHGYLGLQFDMVECVVQGLEVPLADCSYGVVVSPLSFEVHGLRISWGFLARMQNRCHFGVSKLGRSWW